MVIGGFDFHIGTTRLKTGIELRLFAVFIHARPDLENGVDLDIFRARLIIGVGYKWNPTHLGFDPVDYLGGLGHIYLWPD